MKNEKHISGKTAMGIALFAGCMLVFTVGAHAAVLYVQPVANNGTTITGDTPSNLESQVADDFRLAAAAGAPDFLITDLHWVGADLSVDTHADDFVVRFFQDNGSGAPGALFAEFDLEGVSRMDSGLDLPIAGAAFDVFRYNVDLATPFTVQANTPYFISIMEDTSPAVLPGTFVPDQIVPDWVWAWGTDNYAGTQQLVSWTRTGDVGSWDAVRGHDMSFKLTGQVVPEPSTLLLLGAGISAIALRRARKHL